MKVQKKSTPSNPAGSEAGWRGVLLLLLMLPLLGQGAVTSAARQAGNSRTAGREIVVNYPEEGSVFPPDMAPPTFLWHDANPQAKFWRMEISFQGGVAALRAESAGEAFRFGEIDPRCVADTNELPKPAPELAAAHMWSPEADLWEAIQARSVDFPATVSIFGFRDSTATEAVSRGMVRLRTSRDPVGAPIFYRDVPLMPSETEKGVIKPIAAQAVGLIAWRLRHVADSRSRLLMDGLPTCANCHSFSADGRTLGMDLDGPQNHKGMYTLAPVHREMTIGTRDVIEWSSVRGKLEGKLRIGFMSQVSPDGKFVITTIDGSADRSGSPDYRQGAALMDLGVPEAFRPKAALRDSGSIYYVANFADYRFLQVFYPTRGILAWYSRETGHLQPLPGADDPRYVQTGAFWSPDGRFLVFGRAEARDPHPPDMPLAQFANDPKELPIRYDLYRIPFDQGRGGTPEPIAGASRNGMSNNFPKVSPDGKWIVFVQCRNGQLMRPDSRLFIVPAEGGTARPMRCNLPRMNSWHSFSPNGRWMVFSSKSRSPYTQMYLTHIDEEGNDSPAILIENATAANRAVNIPEFVNLPPDGLQRIQTPAVDYYRLVDRALELQGRGQKEAAAAEWGKVLEADPGDANAHNHLGMVLFQAGRQSEAISHFRKAIELNPGFIQAHCNLGGLLAMTGRLTEGVSYLQRAVQLDPAYAPFQNNLGMALMQSGRTAEAIAAFRKAVSLQPGFVAGQCNLGTALAMSGKLEEAAAVLQKAIELDPGYAPAYYNYGLVLSDQGKKDLALPLWKKAVEVNPQYAEARFILAEQLEAAGRPGEAVFEWRKGLEVQPEHIPALSRLAWILATSTDGSLRNGVESVRLAERAVQRSGGKDLASLEALAAAYAEAGRFPEAVQAARQAYAEATRQNLYRRASEAKARLGLYQSGKPCRDTRKPS